MLNNHNNVNSSSDDLETYQQNQQKKRNGGKQTASQSNKGGHLRNQHPVVERSELGGGVAGRLFNQRDVCSEERPPRGAADRQKAIKKQQRRKESP